MRRHVTALMAGLIMVTLLGMGCSRGIKEGLYAVTGSSGEIVRLSGEESHIGNLANEFGGVRVEPFTNEVGAAAPQPFVDALPDAIAKRLQYRSRSLGEKMKGVDKEEAGPFFTGPADKVLVIRGRIIQYEAGDLTDKAISPMDEAICRVQFVDGVSGEMLAEANCTGRSKSSVRTGPQELADGVAKAINKFLKPRDDKN